MQHLKSSVLVCAIGLLSTAVVADAGAKRFLNCDFDSKELGDCDTMGYLYKTLAYIIPGIVMCIITFFVCPVFFCARKCCGCLGGDEPTVGCCCAGTQPAIYSIPDIVRPKVYAIVLVMLGIAVGIWGIIASDLTSRGVLGLIDDLEAAPDRLFDHILRLERALNVTRYDIANDETYVSNLFNGSSAKADAMEVRDSVKDALADNADLARSYIADFTSVMFIIFCLPMGSVVLGGLAAICNCRSCVPMLTAFIMFFVGSVLWLSHGVFSGLALLTGDFCAEIDGLAADRLTVLQTITGCDDQTLSSFTEAFGSIEQSVAGDSCRTMLQMCYDPTRTTAQNIAAGSVFACSGAINCSSAKFGDLARYTENGLSVDSRVRNFPGAQTSGATCNDGSTPCTAVECSEKCRDSAGARSQAGKLAMLTVTDFNAASEVATALDTLGGEYGSCDALSGLMLIPFQGSCRNFADGTLGMRQSSGLGGIVSIGFIFVMAWGSKRFVSLFADTQDDEQQEMHGISISDDDLKKKDPSILPP